MPFNLLPGSYGSLKLLEYLSCANDEMLYGQLQLIIDFKWEQNVWWLKLQNFAAFVHLATMNVHIIFLFKDKNFAVLLLLETIIFALILLLKLYVSDSIQSFVEIGWNQLDIVGVILLLVHCVCFISDAGYKNYYKYHFAVLFAAGCLLLRGVSRISPFSQRIRLLLGVIVQTFKDI